MKKKTLMASVAMALTGSAASFASEPLTLAFNRTGATAETVTVAPAGIEGVSVSLTSVSPQMKTAGTAVTPSVLCADVNGNTSPTITYVFSVAGLPADYTFNNIGLDIHALNGSGAYQEMSDGKTRRWNVDVKIGGSEFGRLDDIDIAAGVGSRNNVHKVWDITASAPVTAVSPVTIELTVTKGSANEGCFFGLGGITFSTVVTEEPPVVEPVKGKIYTIKWKNNTSSYMAEDNSGAVVVQDYSTTNRVFWELVPTGNDNCYYVRNTATGHYIGSCNLQPSSASKIKTGDTPVEYYIHVSAATSGAISGCSWMSSTDCDGYNAENGARALNKDGASSSVITWNNGTDKVGSYWLLTETEDLYEPRPFVPVPTVEAKATTYRIVNAAEPSMSWSHDGQWVELGETDSQRWYFVGVSNAAGGYRIVNGVTGEPINDGASYKVVAEPDGTSYSFEAADGTKLTFDGVSALRISPMRNAKSLELQLYQIPCGSTASCYVTKATIESAGSTLYYPMPVCSGNNVSYPVAPRPGDKYTIVSRDAAQVSDAGLDVTVTLNEAPGANVTAALYFDWNRDGVFETVVTLTPAKEMTAHVDVPREQPEGQSRMRLRITDNGLTGADDDISGQVIDFRLNYVGAAGESVDPTVGVNDPHRGAAVYDGATHMAAATPSGSAAFLFWQEGMRVLSTDSSIELQPLPVKRHVVAVFSPNLEVYSGVTPGLLATGVNDVTVELSADKLLSIKSPEAVNHIFVFATNGEIAAHVAGAASVSLSSMRPGVYIVKVLTATGTATAKILL